MRTHFYRVHKKMLNWRFSQAGQLPHISAFGSTRHIWRYFTPSGRRYGILLIKLLRFSRRNLEAI